MSASGVMIGYTGAALAAGGLSFLARHLRRRPNRNVQEL
jgi:hypothetical protein